MEILFFIILIVILTLLFSFFYIIKKKKKIFFVLTGALCIGIAGTVIYNLALYNNSDIITIKASDDSDLSIEIKNHLLKYEYYFAQFSSELSENEVMDEIASQYGNSFYDSKLKQIGFSYKNQIYTIDNYENSRFLWTYRNKYMFSNNTVEISINSDNYQIPVPLKAIHDSVDVYSEQMKLKCNFDTFSAYYKNFDNVIFRGNSILLMYDNYYVVITISDEDIMTIAVTDSNE